MADKFGKFGFAFAPQVADAAAPIRRCPPR